MMIVRGVNVFPTPGRGADPHRRGADAALPVRADPARQPRRAHRPGRGARAGRRGRPRRRWARRLAEQVKDNGSASTVAGRGAGPARPGALAGKAKRISDQRTSVQRDLSDRSTLGSVIVGGPDFVQRSLPMSSVRSSLTSLNICEGALGSQCTARSLIGIEQVRPFVPSTRVIAQREPAQRQRAGALADPQRPGAGVGDPEVAERVDDRPRRRALWPTAADHLALLAARGRCRRAPGVCRDRA